MCREVDYFNCCFIMLDSVRVQLCYFMTFPTFPNVHRVVQTLRAFIEFDLILTLNSHLWWGSKCQSMIWAIVQQQGGSISRCKSIFSCQRTCALFHTERPSLISRFFLLALFAPVAALMDELILLILEYAKLLIKSTNMVHSRFQHWVHWRCQRNKSLSEALISVYCSQMDELFVSPIPS